MIECNISSKGRKTAKTINHLIVNSINQSISDLLQTLALAACCGGQMMEELKKLDISPDNIEGVEQYTDLSIDEIITQALGGIDRKWVIPMNCRHGYIIKKKEWDRCGLADRLQHIDTPKKNPKTIKHQIPNPKGGGVVFDLGYISILIYVLIFTLSLNKMKVSLKLSSIERTNTKYKVFINITFNISIVEYNQYLF